MFAVIDMDRFRERGTFHAETGEDPLTPRRADGAAAQPGALGRGGADRVSENRLRGDALPHARRGRGLLYP